MIPWIPSWQRASSSNHHVSIHTHVVCVCAHMYGMCMYICLCGVCVHTRVVCVHTCGGCTRTCGVCTYTYAVCAHAHVVVCMHTCGVCMCAWVVYVYTHLWGVCVHAPVWDVYMYMWCVCVCMNMCGACVHVHVWCVCIPVCWGKGRSCRTNTSRGNNEYQTRAQKSASLQRNILTLHQVPLCIKHWHFHDVQKACCWLLKALAPYHVVTVSALRWAIKSLVRTFWIQQYACHQKNKFNILYLSLFKF